MYIALKLSLGSFLINVDKACDGDLVYVKRCSVCEPVCGRETPNKCNVAFLEGGPDFRCCCPYGLYRSSKIGTKCFKKDDCPNTGNNTNKLN